MAVDAYFTPVIGNEVTTASLGHFNVLPIRDEAKLKITALEDSELVLVDAA